MAFSDLCSIPHCGKPSHAAGFCSGHHKRLVRYGDPLHVPPKRNGGRCAIEGCTETARSMGWCPKHYGRFQRNGDPEAGRTPRGLPEQWLRDHLGYTGQECILWPFSSGKYGSVNVEGRKTTPNHIMCELANGPPPTSKHEAAHECGNKLCINPRHLRWATSKENHADRLLHGTDCRGEKCGTARLTQDDVREIRRLYRQAPNAVIAERFGIKPDTVKGIGLRRSWAWLD